MKKRSKRRVKRPAKKKKKQIKRRAKKKVVKKKKKVIRKKPVKKVKKKKTRRKSRQIGTSRRARRHAKLVTGKRKKRKVTKRKPVRRRRHRKVRVIRRTYSGGGPLEQLFESPIKTQVMKLFFRNPESNFLLKEAARIMRVNLIALKKEMKRLEKIGLFRSRKISPRKEVFAINPNFDFFNELKELILKASPISKEKMLKAIRGLGKIKLVLLSGLFMGNETSRADLLIVGNNINQRKLNTFIRNLEAEAGTDVSCVVMNTEEFNYRYDMYDRFVRDLLNEKCEFLVNRLKI